MVPEIAADAPIIGNCSPAWVARCKRRARRRRHRKEREKPQRAEPPRHRAAERQQPHRIDAEMGPVGMDQRIGDEGPNLGAEAARQRAAEHDRGVVARAGMKREAEQELDVLIVAEQQRAHGMNERQQCQHRDDDRRNVEQRFAFHEEGPVGGLSYPLGRFTASAIAKKKGGLSPSFKRALWIARQ